MTGDISKLPRWAQNELTKLRADVESYQERLAEISDENASSYFKISGRKIGIPSGTIIRLHVDGEYVEIKNLETYLYVLSKNAMRIEPHSSNTIKLWSDKYKT